MEEKKITAISNKSNNPCHLNKHLIRDAIKASSPRSKEAVQEPIFQNRHTPDKGQVSEQRALCEQIFQKELTQIDVGKLNRLVISKKHALACFSLYPDISSGGDEEGGEVGAFRLPLFDKKLKLWKFRYCYWKSRQSFVLTKGWYQFVKDNELKAKDIITFYRCEYRDDPKERRFCVIDIKQYNKEGYGSDGKGKRGEEQVNNGVRLFGVQIS